MKKIIIALALLFSASTANAALQYAGHATVKRYYPVDGTLTYFMLDIAHLNPAGCNAAAYYMILNTHPEFEEYRKLILTAKASGQKLGVYLWADPGRCIGSYPEVYSIFIQ